MSLNVNIISSTTIYLIIWFQFATDLWTHPEVFDVITTGLPYVKSQRKVSSPSRLTAKLTKGFKDKYSLYILFPKELTEALNTIIHSKRGEIPVKSRGLTKTSVLMFLHGPGLHFSVCFGWLVCCWGMIGDECFHRLSCIWIPVDSWKTFRPC